MCNDLNIYWDKYSSFRLDQWLTFVTFPHYLQIAWILGGGKTHLHYKWHDQAPFIANYNKKQDFFPKPSSEAAIDLSGSWFETEQKCNNNVLNKIPTWLFR